MTQLDSSDLIATAVELTSPPGGVRMISLPKPYSAAVFTSDCLYVLASYGFARGHLQVLNQYDRCCFRGIRYLTYLEILKDVVRRLGHGRYELFLDSSHATHQISRHALEEAIYPFVRSVVSDATGPR